MIYFIHFSVIAALALFIGVTIALWQMGRSERLVFTGLILVLITASAYALWTSGAFRSAP